MNNKKISKTESAKDSGLQSSKEKKSLKKWAKVGLPVAVGVVLVGGFIWAFVNYQKAQDRLDKLGTAEGQKKVAQEEIQSVIKVLSELILLPEGEEPIVATVKEAEALREKEAFYKNVQPGDKIVIFSQSRKAIIYRPKDNKLVNVGPIVMGDQSVTPFQGEEEATSLEAAPDESQEQEESSASSEISVEIRNGSLESGAANLLAEKFKDNAQYQITKWGNAKNGNYQETIVVDLTGGDPTLKEGVSSLAQEIEAQIVTELPEGEHSSEAEALVIIGENF